MDDIFIAINKILKDVPKRIPQLKTINKLQFKENINFPIVINQDIPPHNQSSMDGIGVKSKQKKYRIKGYSHLNKLNNINIKNDECLIVKTGSLLPDVIKHIIPIEKVLKLRDEYHVLNYDFKNLYIRKRGHILKKNKKIILNDKNLSLKNYISLKSINKLKVKIIPPLSFKIISTGSEFISNHYINPTNAEYIENFLIENGQKVVQNIHLKDNQTKIIKEIKNTSADITIVIGGTGKSKDDIDFSEFNLKIDGLDLKPGRPFKYFLDKKRLILFFPGNPCSSFVLTNILIRSIINSYNFKKKYVHNDQINIKDVDYNFMNLKRKSFLFSIIRNENIKILPDQESSNFMNILNSNCLVYYDKTANLKLYYLDD